MKFERLADMVFVIRNALSQDECASMIAFADDAGFDDAPIMTGRGPIMNKGVRNNSRAIVDDPERADELWGTVSALFPEDLRSLKLFAPDPADYSACGLNERFRFYRYEPGQRFKMHLDGTFRRKDGSGELSLFSVLYYLNGDFEGGETVIVTNKGVIRVEPEPGLVLMFQHQLLHEGAEVTTGTKYVMRTDVMFAPD